MAVFIDSNIFLYAAGTSDDYRDPCINFLRLVADGKIEAYTSTEVAQEVLHVVKRRHGGAQAVALVRNILALFPLILSVERREIGTSCDLISRFPSLSARDAVHLSVMQNNGLDKVVSEDHDFDAIPFVRRISSLETAEILKLLR